MCAFYIDKRALKVLLVVPKYRGPSTSKSDVDELQSGRIQQRVTQNPSLQSMKTCVELHMQRKPPLKGGPTVSGVLL